MAYVFEYDWFTANIPLFERHLERYRGTRCRVLEIGTHEGRSATWMLDNILTHPSSSIVCIDLYEQSTLKSNLAQTFGPWKADVRFGYSHEILAGLENAEFDFAYVDGSHHSCDVLEDAVLTFRKVKVGGVIAFDDYQWDDPEFNQHGTPKPAIDAFLAFYSHKIEVLELDSQVWVRKTGD